MGSDTYKQIYAVVKRIPRGRVATYGQVAWIAGLNNGARQVGYALHALPKGHDVPWHRVVNAQGRISARTWSDGDELQQILLEAEGVVFDGGGRVELDSFRREPRDRKRRPR